MVVNLSGEISRDRLATLRLACLRARVNGERPVVLLDSPGGKWRPACEIAGSLWQSGALAVVRHASSAAAYLAACCPRMIVSPSSRLSFHKPFMPGEPNPDAATAALLRGEAGLFAATLQRKCGLTFAESLELLSSEWSIGGEEAVELGIADRLVSDKEVLG